MTANYTKGEWKAYKDDLGKYSYAIDIKHTGHEKHYAEIAYVCSEADARLIASAPDMYEALQLWTQHNQGTRGHYCSECATAIEKAIAKAEGGNA